MTTLDELHNLMNEAAYTPPGKTHNDLWAKAAELAEAGGFEEEAVISYVHLVNGYATGGQGTLVIAPFIWCDQKIKERPDLFNGDIGFSHSWHYKYVISAVRSVPSVPVQQCEDLLEEMRKHYLQVGDGLRAYHIRKYLFARDWGTEEEANEAFNQWRTAPESELSDCPSCDPGYEVGFAARAGDWQKAVETGEAALARQDQNACDSQPEALLSEMMEPWARVGNDASAWSAHLRAYRRYQEGSRYLEDLPAHLHYLYLAGMAGRPQRLERGLRILLRHLPWWPEADAPAVLLNLAVEGALLFSTLLDEPEQRLQLTLPGEDLVWYPCETLVNPTAQDAYEWMRSLALGIAAQFDNRPGLRFKRNVEAVKRRLQPQLLGIQAEPTLVPDVSGLLSEDLNEYAVQVAGAEADADVAGFESADAAGAAEQELAPITLDTSWQNQSLSQLFQAVVTNLGTFGSHFMFLYHRLLAPQVELPDIAELTVFASDADEAQTIAEFWEAILANRTRPADFPGQFCALPDADTAEAEVLPLLIQASRALSKENWDEALEAANQAMRVPDLQDALGVRLFGLETIGTAYLGKREVNAAAEAYRQLLNLWAALGVTSQQALTGWKLGALLASAGRTDEALAVTQAAADAGELILPSAYESQLRIFLAEQYEEVELFHSALRELLKAEQLQTDKDLKVPIYRKIASVAATEGEFQTAIDYQSRVVEACQNQVTYPIKQFEQRAAGEEYLLALYAAVQYLVGRPGLISDADKAKGRELLESCYEVISELSKFERKYPALDVAVFKVELFRFLLDCYSPEESERQLREALEAILDGGTVEEKAKAYVALSQALKLAGRTAEAREMAKAVLKLKPKRELKEKGFEEIVERILAELDELEQ